MKEQPNGPLELAPGMTTEEMVATFYNKDALLEAPEKVYRLDAGRGRYYYTYDEDGEIHFYISVTTFIRNSMPTSPHLVKWIAEKGYEEAMRYSADRAAYGTFMHMEISAMLIAGRYDLYALKDKLWLYVESQKLREDFMDYLDDFKKDLLSFAKFVIDYDVTPLAIELVLTHPDGYAGAVDLVCAMTIEESGFFGEVYKSGPRKGEPKESKRPKRIRAIIDFKSGRKGFYDEHEVQLHAYWNMWNHNFPDTPVERVYNWSPKDWRTAPSYNLTDQTDSKEAQKLPYYVEIARIEDAKHDRTVVVCDGEINLRDESGFPDLRENIQALSLSELIRQKKEADETPDDDIEITAEDLAAKTPDLPPSEPVGESEQEKQGNISPEEKQSLKTAENESK